MRPPYNAFTALTYSRALSTPSKNSSVRVCVYVRARVCVVVRVTREGREEDVTGRDGKGVQCGY